MVAYFTSLPLFDEFKFINSIYKLDFHLMQMFVSSIISEIGNGTTFSLK